MMYNYLKLADDTQIACSNILEDSTIQVSVERPIDGGFDYATCYLPPCEWSDSEGFSEAELNDLATIIKNNAPLIYRFSREAGKVCA
ncbi:MAG: hypothetical protein V8R08_04730 [Coriobacteriales bacterium]|mgnify:FL=1